MAHIVLAFLCGALVVAVFFIVLLAALSRRREKP